MTDSTIDNLLDSFNSLQINSDTMPNEQQAQINYTLLICKIQYPPMKVQKSN